MNKYTLSSKNKIDISNKTHHNKNTSSEFYAKKEGDIMTEMLEKINKIDLAPSTLHELGMDKNWRDKISPEFTRKVIKTADKYREVLKELSKY